MKTKKYKNGDEVVIEHMTLKQALTKYVDVEDLYVYFFKGAEWTLIESFCVRKHIDELSVVKRILVRLNEDTGAAVRVNKYASGDIRGVHILVGYDDTPVKKFRDRYRKEETK